MSGGEAGYVQFRSDCERGPAPAAEAVAALIAWRQRLHGVGLIGAYPDGVGFGNLSARSGAGAGACVQFIISGTATGGIPVLGPAHFTEVLEHDIARNRLRCRGPVQASSESLSHAAAYRADASVGAVIHVHDAALWEALRGRVPTTPPEALAGTPAMARAVEAVLADPAARAAGVLVMGGHPEGVLAFGATVAAAGGVILAHLAGRAG